MATTTTRSALSWVTWVAIALVVLGAINWGLVGLFNFNLVAAIFGSLSTLTRIVYVLVGVAGLYLVFASTRFGAGPTSSETRLP